MVDGPFVGDWLWSIDGIDVVLDDGFTDGEAVGITVGPLEGTAEGSANGFVEGAVVIVGEAVGVLVGEDVGLLVGEGEGSIDFDGDGEGIGVGDTHVINSSQMFSTSKSTPLHCLDASTLSQAWSVPPREKKITSGWIEITGPIFARLDAKTFCCV